MAGGDRLEQRSAGGKTRTHSAAGARTTTGGTAGGTATAGTATTSAHDDRTSTTMLRLQRPPRTTTRPCCRCTRVGSRADMSSTATRTRCRSASPAGCSVRVVTLALSSPRIARQRETLPSTCRFFNTLVPGLERRCTRRRARTRRVIGSSASHLGRGCPCKFEKWRQRSHREPGMTSCCGCSA